MYLCYVHDSGNTGMRLNDSEQPLYVLGGVVVLESEWRSCVTHLRSVIKTAADIVLTEAPGLILKDLHVRREWTRLIFPGTKKERLAECSVHDVIDGVPEFLESNRFQLNGPALCHGYGCFRGIPDHQRESIVRTALGTLEKDGCRFLASTVNKPKLMKKYDDDEVDDDERFPPDLIAMGRLTELFEQFLRGAGGLGIIVAGKLGDAHEARRRLVAYKELGEEYPYGSEVKCVIDPIHFVDSRSPMIQAAELVTYLITQEERSTRNWPKERKRIAERLQIRRF